MSNNVLYSDWAKRYDLQRTPEEIKSMIEDAQTLTACPDCARKDKLIVDLWKWFQAGCSHVHYREMEKKLEERIEQEGIKFQVKHGSFIVSTDNYENALKCVKEITE